MLPIPYFHLVFTIPHELGSLALQNKRVVYGILFRAAAQTVSELAADPKHRVAISNQRLTDMCDGIVRFRYKDYAHARQTKTMTLASEEFMRRFLMHTLPSGFVRIRYYGFLALRCGKHQLRRCRQLLDVPLAQESDRQAEPTTSEDTEPVAETTRCPACKTGTLTTKCTLLPHPALRVRAPHFLRTLHTSAYYNDSS